MAHQIAQSNEHVDDWDRIDADSEGEEITSNEEPLQTAESFIDFLDTFGTFSEITRPKVEKKLSDTSTNHVSQKQDMKKTLQNENYDGTSSEDDNSDPDSYSGKTCSLSTDSVSSARSGELSSAGEETASSSGDGGLDLSKIRAETATDLDELGSSSDSEEDDESDEFIEDHILKEDALGLAAVCTAVLVGGMWILENGRDAAAVL